MKMEAKSNIPFVTIMRDVTLKYCEACPFMNEKQNARILEMRKILAR